MGVDFINMTRNKNKSVKQRLEEVSLKKIMLSICFDLFTIFLVIYTNSVFFVSNLSDINLFGFDISAYFILLGEILLPLEIFFINKSFILKASVCVVLNDLMLASIAFGMSQIGISARMSDILGTVFAISILYMIISLLKSKRKKYIFLFIYSIFLYVFHTQYLTRGVNFIPKELVLWKTILSVVDNYEIIWFNWEYIGMLIYIVFGIMVINRSYIYGDVLITSVKKFKIKLNFFSRIMCILTIIIGFIILSCQRFSIWHWRYNVPDSGIITTLILLFTLNTGYKPIEYDVEYYNDEYLEQYINSEIPIIEPTEKTPNIIMICLEAFDTNFKNVVHLNKNPTEFFDSLKNKSNTQCGYVIPNIEFGLTANSEYELLTNLNTAEELSQNTLVFDMVMEKPIKSNADFFNYKGYNSVYMHPFYSTGYSRNKKISDLGFNRTFFIENMVKGNWKENLDTLNSNNKQSDISQFVFNGDTLNAEEFEGIDSYRGFPSDKQNFEKVLDIINTSQKPVYLFNMTVQNHGSWDKDRDIAKGVDKYEIECIDNFDNDVINEVESFVNSLYQTDKALKGLYDEVIKLGEPTVVCICGDHNAALVELLQKTTYGDWMKDNPLEGRKVPYYMFANFKIKQSMSENKIFSMSYLTQKLLDFIEFDYSVDKTLSLVKKISDQVDIITYDVGYVKNNSLIIDRNSINGIDTYKGLQYYRLYDCNYQRSNKINSE